MPGPENTCILVHIPLFWTNGAQFPSYPVVPWSLKLCKLPLAQERAGWPMRRASFPGLTLDSPETLPLPDSQLSPLLSKRPRC